MARSASASAPDVATCLRIGRGTVRKVKQNWAWAVDGNAFALLFAACVLQPTFGLVPRAKIAAITMVGSSLLVAVNALSLKHLHLPAAADVPAAAAVVLHRIALVPAS